MSVYTGPLVWTSFLMRLIAILFVEVQCSDTLLSKFKAIL